MAESPAQFIWYDLMTTDTQAAASFYQQVMGWEAAYAAVNGRPYTVLSISGTPVAGLMPIPDEANASSARPVWMGYIGVEDVDASTARVVEQGGSVSKAPHDIPGVGRSSIVADPQGAVLNLYKPQPRTSELPFPGGTEGSICWRELNTTDLEAAQIFYTGLFGWSKGEAISMGEMGTYLILTGNGVPFGGMAVLPPEAPVPCWNFYFSVDEVGAAVERVSRYGGTTFYGPSQVPGG